MVVLVSNGPAKILELRERKEKSTRRGRRSRAFDVGVNFVGENNFRRARRNCDSAVRLAMGIIKRPGYATSTPRNRATTVGIILFNITNSIQFIVCQTFPKSLTRAFVRLCLLRHFRMRKYLRAKTDKSRNTRSIRK